MVLGLEGLMEYTGIPAGLLIIAIAWTLVWDGLALWRSARLRQPIWFIVILLVNTLGILEILYLFIFSKMDYNKVSKRSKKSRKARSRVPSRKRRR